MPAPILTPPETWVNGEVTVAQMNARVRDKITELQTAVTPVAAVNLTLASGVTNEIGIAQACSDGRFGLAWGALVYSTTSGLTTIATLPSSIAPLVTIYATAWGSAAGAVVAIKVNTSGIIEAQTISGTPTRVRFSVTFPV